MTVSTKQLADSVAATFVGFPDTKPTIRSKDDSARILGSDALDRLLSEYAEGGR